VPIARSPSRRIGDFLRGVILGGGLLSLSAWTAIVTGDWCHRQLDPTFGFGDFVSVKGGPVFLATTFWGVFHNKDIWMGDGLLGRAPLGGVSVPYRNEDGNMEWGQQGKAAETHLDEGGRKGGRGVSGYHKPISRKWE